MKPNKRYADYAKRGEYPPEFQSTDKRLGDISFQLNKIAKLLEELINKLTNQ